MAKSAKKKKISTVLYILLGLIAVIGLGVLGWFLYMQFSPIPPPVFRSAPAIPRQPSFEQLVGAPEALGPA